MHRQFERRGETFVILMMTPRIILSLEEDR